MAWSTQQLAGLANTTVNAVRHYHRVELLDLPDRAANGYKQYGVPHLIRLLQIKRLGDLGFSLAQVAGMDRPGGDPADEIRALDAELAATMERLAAVRAELATILEHGAAADIPPGFAAVSGEISESQRSMLSVYSTVFDESALEALSHAVAERSDVDDEFERIPADANDATIDALAARMVPVVLAQREKHPQLSDALTHSTHGEQSAESTVAQALAEVYNPAQLRTLKRMGELLPQEYPA
ncbi:helix-turn-helix domain-containing protein [Arthrobacter sp. CG_A4]|uniref:helix-turn-helix domain-containing protein n=1 Tax=Arthrobacter sp. CG_A4 TaxID=3071706 RepID=UPI002E07C5AB|nr:DNA-binding transcriptional MerR regulator [Arthrobacter sp. CG_A4]